MVALLLVALVRGSLALVPEPRFAPAPATSGCRIGEAAVPGPGLAAGPDRADVAAPPIQLHLAAFLDGVEALPPELAEPLLSLPVVTDGVEPYRRVRRRPHRGRATRARRAAARRSAPDLDVRRAALPPHADLAVRPGLDEPGGGRDLWCIDSANGSRCGPGA